MVKNKSVNILVYNQCSATMIDGGQVMDIADEIAYDSHDLDDGIKSGMIDEKSLKKIDIFLQFPYIFNSLN